jgi:Uma2 family endonuclease
MVAHRPYAPVFLTVEEFEEYDLPEPYERAELVRGELQLIPLTGFRHGDIGARILERLSAFVRTRHLGVVTMASGYVLVDLPHTVRGPDIAFIAANNLPPEFDRARVPRFRPDLAVEVLSPSDTRKRIEEKLDDYEAVGIPLVWVVDPEQQTISVFAEGEAARVLVVGDTLDGGSLLPGFELGLIELFQ